MAHTRKPSETDRSYSLAGLKSVKPKKKLFYTFHYPAATVVPRLSQGKKRKAGQRTPPATGRISY